MSYKHFKPSPSRYGSMPVFVSATLTQTQNTTVNNLVAVPRRRCFIEKATVTLTTLGVDNDGTIVGTLYAVATNGSTARAISSGLSLESNGVATALVPVDLTIPGTTTIGSRFLNEGETLRFAIVSSATTDTAPVGQIAVELLVQE